jgi:hypothetical protein
MGGFSIWHWLILIVWFASFVAPLWRILPRAGISAWISLFGFIPLGALVLWWVLAFKDWPGDEKAQTN